jgi:hypothetical protein
MPTTRVLVALEPGMYAEGLAFMLGKRRPRAEVSLLGPSEDVEAITARYLKHQRSLAREAIERLVEEEGGDPGGVEGAKLQGAEISADGYSRSVADVRTEHVLEALDRAEEELLGSGHAREGG